MNSYELRDLDSQTPRPYAFVLRVFPPSGMELYAVDYLEYTEDGSIAAYITDPADDSEMDLVVQFPADAGYVLARRDRFERFSVADRYERQLEREQLSVKLINEIKRVRGVTDDAPEDWR